MRRTWKVIKALFAGVPDYFDGRRSLMAFLLTWGEQERLMDEMFDERERGE